MKKKMIKRKVILDAIKNEPLDAFEFVKMVSGNFDDLGNYTPSHISTDKNCPVCAVGAVLRNSGLDNLKISAFGNKMSDCGSVREESRLDAKRAIEEFLEKGKYLHALSVKFERQADMTGTGKKTRSILSAFVKKHFPKEIKLDPRY
jgi:hypothetical protein